MPIVGREYDFEPPMLVDVSQGGYSDDLHKLSPEGFEVIQPGQHMVYVGISQPLAEPRWEWVCVSYREGRTISGFTLYGCTLIRCDWKNVLRIDNVPKSKWEIPIALTLIVTAFATILLLRLTHTV